ncbi:MAG: BrnA antitoxin family protein [Reyranella sp.]|nr:BrnA antitoxin family protein [Reyranella sp.]
MRGKQLHTSGGATKRKPLSTAERRQLAALGAKADEAIDTKDIPEAPAANWRLAQRGDLYRPVKQPITIRLDSDIVTWFKARGRGRGYQTEINSALRKYVAGRNR